MDPDEDKVAENTNPGLGSNDDPDVTPVEGDDSEADAKPAAAEAEEEGGEMNAPL
jgi:hypothetical protein